ncbi:histidine phosphotransferase ChpT [Rhodovulum imhoffii]|uniref:Histidine phosphotransferase ChpT n=1 Tax=Rhodovulum imhoffii TaxID=365340 RepID=A0A2T5BT84_9RHOB|nr:histidine phosphotransferase family protein [Rhodovulum imhoffii]MBK5932972.1 hypothetical protein [Rhodovulum imhoffii]PTN02640.1 histidine phosphotransferase ChpT [Rhodovulum imhoffii]
MTDLTSLVGSRICHDIISPLGAIGNGVELLSMGGAGTCVPLDGPELEMISQSVENANTRIRLFRLAFGAAPAGQEVPGREVQEVLRGAFNGPRLSTRADLPATLPRAEARLILLSAMCLQSALPVGGTLRITPQRGGWQVEATGPRLELQDRLWACLRGQGAVEDLRAAEVQFALLPRAAEEAGRTLRLETGLDRAVLRF